MNRETKESREAREVGSHLAYYMQEKRKLFKLTNLLINELARYNPRALRVIIKMNYPMKDEKK